MYNRILVPLDGSKLSECSLSHVKNIARGNQGAEVILFSVQEEIKPSLNFPSSESAAREMVVQRDKMNQQAKEAIEKYLADIAEDFNKQGIKVKTMILSDPVKTIPEIMLNYIGDNEADLVVMSTHGRTGISRWAFGSVADRVVNYSRIPVLIIPPAQCRV